MGGDELFRIGLAVCGIAQLLVWLGLAWALMEWLRNLKSEANAYRQFAADLGEVKDVLGRTAFSLLPQIAAGKAPNHVKRCGR